MWTEVPLGLMQIAKAGKCDCGVRCIHEFIGKEAFSATSLKNLKDAADKLGFSARGYKPTISKLVTSRYKPKR